MTEDTISEKTHELGEDESFYIGSPQEQRLGKVELERRMKDIHVEVKIDQEDITPEMQELVDTTEQFAKRSIIGFQDTFWTEMDRYAEEHPHLVTEELRAKIKEKGFDTPKFTILHGDYALDFLEDANLASNYGYPPEITQELRDEHSRVVKNENADGVRYYDVYKNSVYVVFNLPKPLAEYWWKGGLQWGAKGEDMGGMVFEWGNFYRECLPVVWEEQGYEQGEGDLFFERLNRNSQHDPSKYYYVWQVDIRQSEETSWGGYIIKRNEELFRSEK